MENLPPLVLIKAWLQVIEKSDLPVNIRNQRSKLLTYHFGSIDKAQQYVEENEYQLTT